MKKINYLRIVGIIISFIVSTGCEKDRDNCHFNLFLRNNSSTDVYMSVYPDYPDTLLLNKGNYNPVNSANEKIARNSMGGFHGRSCWESVIANKSIGRDTLMVFIFDAKTLETMSWDSVKTQNLFLKRYDLSLKDLQDKNWQLTFP